MKNLLKLSILAAIALLIPRSSGRPQSNAKNKTTAPHSSNQSNPSQTHQNNVTNEHKVDKLL